MPTSATPLAGVGDEALWAEELHEVIAEKNDVLCDIQVTDRVRGTLTTSTAAERQQIGALCNRILAAAP